MKKLNIGSNDVVLSGWVNIDIQNCADVCADVRKGIPFGTNTVDFIFSEHFIEHLDFGEGTNFFKECYRVLIPGGMVRTATVDLDYVIEKYRSDWRNQTWMCHPAYGYIKTPGMMINVVFRSWGHLFVYNGEDLALQLSASGFRNIRRCQFKESSCSELSNLELRPDSKLIIEATK